jgi:hypothetical protein
MGQASLDQKALNRAFAPSLERAGDAALFRAAERSQIMAMSKKDFAGWCAACNEAVGLDEPDGPVWTCPADLSENNRNRESEPYYCDAEITDEMREKSGCYSNCWEDFGKACYDRLPLHSACHEKGGY